MPREKSVKREAAYEIWKENILKGSRMKLKDIASELGVKDSTIRKWKCNDNWEGKLMGENPNNKKHPEKARFANKNSRGNKGGAPKGNENNLKNGFFSRIFPEDVLEIADEIERKDPIDILWENIVIQYIAIARAQKIMYVKDSDDTTKELKRSRSNSKNFSNDDNNEYEIKFAFEKYESYLQAQSRAMATLQSLILKYEELLNRGLATQEQELRIEKLKTDIAKIKGEDELIEDDGFIAALNKKGGEVWND